MLWRKRQIDLRTKTLSQDYLFRFVLVLGVAISLFLVVRIICVEYDALIFLCTTSECFSNTLEVFKLPITFLTGVFAVAGFVAVVFRSQQTAIQIQETINQNHFKNYIDHKKQFMELLKGLEDKEVITFFNREEFYLELFPFNSPENTEFKSRSIDSDRSVLEYRISSYNEHLKRFNSMSQGFEQSQLAKWLAGFICDLASFHIRFDKEAAVSEPFKKYFPDGENLQKYPKDLRDAFYRVEEVLMALCAYCLPLEKKMEIQQLVTFNNAAVTTLLDGISEGTVYD